MSCPRSASILFVSSALALSTEPAFDVEVSSGAMGDAFHC